MSSTLSEWQAKQEKEREIIRNAIMTVLADPGISAKEKLQVLLLLIEHDL